MSEIAIYGAGGFGREVKLIIDQLIQKGESFEFLGYFDDKDKSRELGDHYLGNLDSLNKWKEELQLVIAIGSSTHRKNIAAGIANEKISFPILISPYAIFNGLEEVYIEKGCIICAGANLTTNIKIGAFSVINLNATIGHDAVLSSFVSIMPGVNIAGEVTLKESVYVGSGANILNSVTIEHDTIVGSGAVVTSSCGAHETLIGIPAKKLEK
jgi:sugar O-acyltransferase (sialic acid O-acetyltransferase NeuD family)